MATVDSETLDRARRNDRAALAEVWRIYHPQLLRFLRSQQAPSVDDVASEVWIDVGRAIARFDGDGRAFQRWLFTIASRRAVDEHRRAARRPAPLEDADSERRVDSSAAADQGLDDGVDEAIALLRRLPPNMAAVVMLRAVHGLTVAETAAVLGCSQANVRVLAHRGLGRLRSFLDTERPVLRSVAPETAHTAVPFGQGADV